MRKILRSEEQLALQGLLKEARRRANLTQEALASSVGKPQSFVAKYESGERLINVIELMYLLSALNQSPVEFISQLSSKMTDLSNVRK